MHFNEPVIDQQNPCYCPSVTAITYLESLRRQLRKNPSRHANVHEKLRPSFSKRLEQSLDEDDVINLLYQPIPAARDSPDISSLLNTSLQHPPMNWAHGTPAPLLNHFELPLDPPGLKLKRKRSYSAETFSDMLAPPRHERSFQSVNDDSFYLSAKADRICYFPDGAGDSSPRGHKRVLVGEDSEHRMRVLEDELYGPHIGAETPRGLEALTHRLNVLLPGIRLKERLYARDTVSHQHIADMLGADGHLNARVLHVLRTSEVKALDLTASIMDEAGLNLGASDLLHVLKKPNSFLFVTDISLGDTNLQDFDLTHIHHLPRLTRLWLSNTGIGNEAIFHLVALRRTLAELDLALNPRIDDDAIPALLALPKLRFVSLYDTSVGMPGLRRLATAREGSAPDIEVPRACEEYIDNMHRKYELHLPAPLATDPTECVQLSPSALKRNLEAHAAVNSQVLVGGTHEEMTERLERILVMRAMDMAVREMVWREGQDIDGNPDADLSVF